MGAEAARPGPTLCCPRVAVQILAMDLFRTPTRGTARHLAGATLFLLLSIVAGAGTPVNARWSADRAGSPSQRQDTLAAPGRTGRGPLRVLFIGNSYTYFNDLPSVLADLALSARESRPLLAEQVLVGGATLESHLTRGEATRRIRKGSSAGPWDLVVLQEQSTRPLEDTAAMYRAVRALAAEARNVGARTVLYTTWARAARPLAQDTLTNAYRRIGGQVSAIIVPVGDAWALVRNDDAADGRTLFVEDGSHPSPAGTYLAASVFYAVLYGRSPVGLAPATRLTTEQPNAGAPAEAAVVPVERALAARLQAAAARVMR